MRSPAEVVNIGYVINVIEDPQERSLALREAWELTQRVLVIAARLESERPALASVFNDGCLTTSGTFQKFFYQDELHNWIATVLDERPVSAGPGVFYVFRADSERERFVSSRYRRRRPVSLGPLEANDLFTNNSGEFAELVEFLAERGRMPQIDELKGGDRLIDACGSLRRALRAVESIAGRELWTEARQLRTEDYLVYLALSRFTGRPRFSQLPVDIQRDLRSFFGSYKSACLQADQLLFSLRYEEVRRRASRSSPLGKLTPSALYVHVSALEKLPPALRVYEGCARSFLGDINFSTIIKLHFSKPAVSYLEYQDFDRHPHPSLGKALHVDLGRREERLRDFSVVLNPPILHRKELFVAKEHPSHKKFQRLTSQEERAGLFEKPEAIGTREGWNSALAAKGWTVRGHRLVKAEKEPRRHLKEVAEQFQVGSSHPRS